MVAVDGGRQIRPDERRQVDYVHIHEVHRLHNPVPHVQVLVRALEVPHGERSFLELECHEAVQVFIHLLPAQLPMADVPLSQDVHHLAHLHMELLPCLRVILHESTLHRLLRNNKIGGNLGVWSSLEVFEIAFREERHVLRDLMVIRLFAEDVLLLQRISLTKCLDDVVQHVREGEILVCVRTELLYGVLHLNDDGAVSTSGEQHRIEVSSLIVLHILQLGEQAIQRFLFPKHPRIV